MNNLSTIFHKLLRLHFRLYATIATGSFLLAFGLLYFATAPQWQVSGLVRIGQTPMLNSEQQLQIESLMPRDVSIALIRQEANKFIQNGTSSNSDWSLRVRPVADDLLEVKIQARSIEEAAERYAALIRRLKVLHDEIYAARNEFWIAQNSRLSADIAIEQNALASQASTCKAFANQPSEKGLLCANLLANESARLDRKKQYQSKIQESLLPIWSYPTNTLGSLNHSDRPVYPKGLTSAALSLFITLVLLMLLLIFGSIWTLLGQEDRQTR